VQQIADLFGVPRSTVYGHLKSSQTPAGACANRTGDRGERADIVDPDCYVLGQAPAPIAVEINRYRQIYNTIRPHQALADRTPRDVYLGGSWTHAHTERCGDNAACRLCLS
jgi:hypothetical protein